MTSRHRVYFNKFDFNDDMKTGIRLSDALASGKSMFQSTTYWYSGVEEVYGGPVTCDDFCGNPTIIIRVITVTIATRIMKRVVIAT